MKKLFSATVDGSLIVIGSIVEGIKSRKVNFTFM